MESTPDQEAEGAAVIKVLSAVLDRLVSANSSLASLDPGVITRFHALKPPSISVLLYLQRVHKYASCSTECFILALIYIDRLIQRNNFLLSELNVHRVVITSIMLAAKFFDDQYFNNAYYAKVGGVPAHEMNSLEVEFLFRINFSLHVTPDLYFKYHSELVTHAVAADGSKVGVLVGGGEGTQRMPCMVPPSPDSNPAVRSPYGTGSSGVAMAPHYPAARDASGGSNPGPTPTTTEPGHGGTRTGTAWPPPAAPHHHHHQQQQQQQQYNYQQQQQQQQWQPNPPSPGYATYAYPPTITHPHHQPPTASTSILNHPQKQPTTSFPYHPVNVPPHRQPVPTTRTTVTSSAAASAQNLTCQGYAEYGRVSGAVA